MTSCRENVSTGACRSIVSPVFTRALPAVGHHEDRGSQPQRGNRPRYQHHQHHGRGRARHTHPTQQPEQRCHHRGEHQQRADAELQRSGCAPCGLQGSPAPVFARRLVRPSGSHLGRFPRLFQGRRMAACARASKAAACWEARAFHASCGLSLPATGPLLLLLPTLESLDGRLDIIAAFLKQGKHRQDGCPEQHAAGPQHPHMAPLNGRKIDKP